MRTVVITSLSVCGLRVCVCVCGCVCTGLSLSLSLSHHKSSSYIDKNTHTQHYNVTEEELGVNSLEDSIITRIAIGDLKL